MSATNLKPNIVVIGGSYVGLKFVDTIAPLVHETHNTVLLEKNSHFEHLFAFPRASVISGFAHKAFIPYTNSFHASPPGSVSFVHGAANQILPDQVVLQTGEKIPYEYLVLATGTGLQPLRSRVKADEVAAFEVLEERVKNSQNVVVIGGGASGVQMVCDAKEHYPSKNVTLIHSRDQLMNRFHPELHKVVMNRLEELGINVVLGQRVKLPPSIQYPVSGPSYNVELANGRLIPADVAISCIGAVPLSQPLASLSPQSIDASKFIRVRPTLQITDERYPKIFSVGDVAATGGNKNARSGAAQAAVAAANIQRMIAGGVPTEEYAPSPFGIHMSVGLWRWLLFMNPATPDAEPTCKHQNTEEFKGTEEGVTKWEMGCARLWGARAPGVNDFRL